MTLPDLNPDDDAILTVVLGPDLVVQAEMNRGRSKLGPTPTTAATTATIRAYDGKGNAIADLAEGLHHLLHIMWPTAIETALRTCNQKDG